MPIETDRWFQNLNPGNHDDVDAAESSLGSFNFPAQTTLLYQSMTHSAYFALVLSLLVHHLLYPTSLRQPALIFAFGNGQMNLLALDLPLHITSFYVPEMEQVVETKATFSKTTSSNSVMQTGSLLAI